MSICVLSPTGDKHVPLAPVPSWARFGQWGDTGEYRFCQYLHLGPVNNSVVQCTPVVSRNMHLSCSLDTQKYICTKKASCTMRNIMLSIILYLTIDNRYYKAVFQEKSFDCMSLSNEDTSGGLKNCCNRCWSNGDWRTAYR
jgi:hypothetical protein